MTNIITAGGRCCRRAWLAILAMSLAMPVQFGHAETVVSGRRTEPRQAVLVWVEAPRNLKRGATATLRIKVLNARDEAFSFSGVTISGEYLAGFEVVGVDPKPISMDQTWGDLDLVYDRTVEANGEWQARVNVRAKKYGAFVGDVDIEFGDTSYTRTAQTLVR